MHTRNNFDFLRLLLALGVLLVHTHVLSRADALAPLSRHLNSTHAVWAFFVVSGYLIAMSYERSRSDRAFALKRLRRVVPAYAFVVLAAAVAGAFLTTLPLGAYVSARAVYAYLLANLTFLNFLQPSLPGVFAGNPYGPEVNGALWSIRSELACYALVPVVYWLVSRIGRGAAVGLLAAACAAASAGLLEFQTRTDRPGLSVLKLAVADCGLCFACGVACWYYREHLRSRWFAAAGAACSALLLLRIEFGAWAEVIVRPIVLTGAVVFVGLRLPYLGNWGRFGDVSYGVYIYHFPVIQSLVSLGWFATAPLAALGGTVLITLALAVASWWLIEAPCLASDSHYVKAARGEPIGGASGSTPAEPNGPGGALAPGKTAAGK
jgi:peptidoglycan/LPS O-acetylase OafA/YrhL